MNKAGAFALIVALGLGVTVLTLILINLGVLVIPGSDDQSVTTELGTTLLERKDLRTYLDLDGILEYGDSVQVSPSDDGVLTYVAPEGAELNRGSVVLRVYESANESEILSADQQIASANASVAQAELSLENLNALATAAQIASADASVAQAELSLENLNAPATAAQIASADASVAQAELSLENLNAPATAAQIASADASVAQAELSLENLNAPATAAQIASADASVAQAETSLVSAEGSVSTSWASRRIAHKALCDKAAEIGSSAWIYKDPICPANTSELTAAAMDTVIEMITNDHMVTENNTLLNAHQSYQSALASLVSVNGNLSSAQAQRSALDELPTVGELAQATEALKSAQAQRSALDELPTVGELAQATEALKSAQAQRSALDELPTVGELAQATASLESAKVSLHTAMATRNDLTEAVSAMVLMFGNVPAWREFREGMTPGEDVEQLEQNLISLGYGSDGSLSVDQNFDTATSNAIKSMQIELGVVASGSVDFGEVIFLPGKSIVEYIEQTPNLGASVTQNTPLLLLTPIDRTTTQIGQDLSVSISTESLQQVKTSIEVADQDLIDIGSAVKIELPDELVVQGTVTKIENVAVVPSGNQAGNPYLEVYVDIDGNTSFREWTGAPVTVSVTSSLADDVLAAPITSLVALMGGGYALEMADQSGTNLVAVETGVYADGWVEVTGTGIDVGTEVVVPR